MNAYCDRQSVEFNSIAFLFDGRRLRGEQTPDEVDFYYFHVLRTLWFWLRWIFLEGVLCVLATYLYNWLPTIWNVLNSINPSFWTWVDCVILLFAGPVKRLPGWADKINYNSWFKIWVISVLSYLEIYVCANDLLWASQVVFASYLLLCCFVWIVHKTSTWG